MEVHQHATNQSSNPGPGKNFFLFKLARLVSYIMTFTLSYKPRRFSKIFRKITSKIRTMGVEKAPQ